MAVRLGKQLAQDVWVGDSAVKQEASDFWQHTDQRVGDDRLHPHHTTVCCLNCALGKSGKPQVCHQNEHPHR